MRWVAKKYADDPTLRAEAERGITDYETKPH
jgi:hypothetical protein